VGPEELLVVHPDGSGAHLVVRDVHDSPMAWSPDGRITFSRATATGAIRLFTVRPDGRGLRAVGGSDGTADVAPAWSRDATLVYSADPRQQTAADRAQDGAPVDGPRAGHLVATDQAGRTHRTLSDPPPGADDGSPTLGPPR
jgi:hypothetical protein